MSQLNIPSSPTLYTTSYSGLRGVDYSCDITEVNKVRTPTGVNMISDDGGNPIKRRGWRVYEDLECGEIFKIIFHTDNEGAFDPDKIYVIAENGIYVILTLSGTRSYQTLLSTTVTSAEYFLFNGEVYAIVNGGMYKLHGTTAEGVESAAYVPETTITLHPDGTNGYSLEAVNILTPKRMFSFTGDNSSLDYYLYPATVRAEDAYKYIVKSTIKVELLTISGWSTLTVGTDYTLSGETTINALNANGVKTAITVVDAKVHFTTAHSPLVVGQDNVRITFEAFDNSASTVPDTYTATATASSGTATVSSNANYQSFFPACSGKTAVFTYQEHNGGNYWHTPLHDGKWISNWGSNTGISYSGTPALGDTVTVVSTVSTYCKVGLYKETRKDLLTTTACMAYGYTAVDRIFLTGGINKNRIYYSQVNQPMYFPDNNYLTVGHDNNGIVGLHRVSEYLAAVKEDSAIEGTVFLISGAYLDDNMYFKVTATSAGTGAIASKTFDTLIDEPLFLARSGVFAIANYYTTTEKVIRNRSYLVDKKLTAEPNLQNACAVTWRRYYILCVNSHCYVLDGRSKTADAKNNTDYLYEAYYWENIPACVFMVHDDELYFGTTDGKLCKFNTDILGLTKYSDNGEEIAGEGGLVIEGGEAIVCEWSTPLDDDKKPQYFKNLRKKGALVTLLPYDQSSAKVYLSKNGDKSGSDLIYLGMTTMDIFSWENINFERFTFNSNDSAQDDYFRKKVKKYKRLQIIVKNDGLYEPFGILQIVKTYTVGNFAK